MQTFRKGNDKRKEGKRRKADQNIKYNESCPEIFQNTCIKWTAQIDWKRKYIIQEKTFGETPRFWKDIVMDRLEELSEKY